MAVNYKICPYCGSMKTLEIVYGMPTHDTFVKAEEGKIIALLHHFDRIGAKIAARGSLVIINAFNCKGFAVL